MQNLTETERKRTIIWWTVALSLIALFPIVLFQYPGLQDYPNHLARAFILQNADDPIFRHYFSLDYSLVPNLGWDIFAISIGRLFPLEYAGKIFIVLSCIILVGGCFALNRAIVGRWTITPILVFPFIFNTGFNKGFLGFNLGIGLTLWAAAWWASLDESRWRIRLSGAIIFSTVLYVIHFYAWACYGIFVLGWALRTAAARANNPSAVLEILGRLMRDGLQAVPPAILALITFTRMKAEQGSAIEPFRNFQPPYSRISDLDRLIDLGTPFINDILLVLVCIVFLFAVYRRNFRFTAGATLSICLCILLFFALPSKIEETNFVSWRVLFAGLLFLFSSLDSTEKLDRNRFPSFVILIAIVTGAISVLHVRQWHGAQASQADLFRVMASVPEGSSVFFVRDGASDKELGTRVAGLYHIGAFAILQRRAVVQSLFTFVGQQPLRYRNKELQNAPERSNTFLPNIFPAFKEAGLNFQDHVNKFDFVIVHHDQAQPETNFAIDKLQLVSTSGPFRLFRTMNTGPKFSKLP